jgi:hypothetical protein
MHVCHVCKKELVIEIYPDYASSAMWCKQCGVNFANPKKEFRKIPIGLIYLIQIWNDYWDNTCSNIEKDSFYLDKIQQEFNCAGYFLAEKLSQYYPCEFDEEKSKIYSLKDSLRGETG